VNDEGYKTGTTKHWREVEEGGRRGRWILILKNEYNEVSKLNDFGNSICISRCSRGGLQTAGSCDTMKEHEIRSLEYLGSNYVSVLSYS
jgi:hypothetical protein